MFFFKLFAKFFGVIMIIVGIVSLLSFLIAFFTVGITDAVHFPGMDFLEAANAANIPIPLMSFLLFLAIGIPFFFIFYLGLRILVSNLKSIGNTAKFTLLGLWIISILGLVVVGVRQATEHAYDAEVVSKQELAITASDTLVVKMNNMDNYNNRIFYRNGGQRIIEDDNGRKILFNDVRFRMFSSNDSTATVSIIKNADGSSYRLAKERAEAVEYDIELKNGILLLDRYLKTDTKYKFSDQSIEVIINVPEGTTVLLDKNTSRYQRYYINGILSDIRDGYFHRVNDDGATCLDCPVNSEEDNEELEVENETTSVNISTEEGIVIKSGDSINVKVNGQEISNKSSEIQVNINEENGIEIKSKDDN